MMEEPYYVIRGGVRGRERLRILSRVMSPTTLALLRRAGARPGMTCLEVGCGGGDIALELARMVQPAGKVIGIDIDPEKVDIARREAEAAQATNIQYQVADITKNPFDQEFDFIHARFVLTHLPNPERAVAEMRQALRSGGVIVLEDIDFRGHFCHPDCPALWRYIELYTQAVQLRGGDANIGPRLPALLQDAAFENIQMNVVQPAGIKGEVKLLAAFTMENIAEAVLAEGLADKPEIDMLVEELYEFGLAPGTVVSLPRIVEAWGSRSEP